MDSGQMTVVLIGNQGVGKRDIFRGLTGPQRRAGRRAGGGLDFVGGKFTYNNRTCFLVELPDIWSVSGQSEESAAARRYLCSGKADAVVVVSDALRLERGLHLLKQVLSLEYVKDQGIPLVLCVSGCDEAGKRGIQVDFDLLQDVLQFPVISCRGGQRENFGKLKEAIAECGGVRGCYDCLDFSPKQLAGETVNYTRGGWRRREEMIDRIVTSRFAGSMLMVFLVMGAFWLTMAGARYPSVLLWNVLSSLDEKLPVWLGALHVPKMLVGVLSGGVYPVLAWVISVMLPPMTIFFLLFTLLEELGYLPRAAFCMDRPFRHCGGCGKQCLTMTMGLGCNAAGVTSCRIIDSPRERLTAILTNSLIPCNGRFPTLIALIPLFFVAGLQGNKGGFLVSALFLTAAVVAGVVAAMGCSWLLSATLLKNLPSTFILELPPYRRPQAGKVLVRSLVDRTLSVLVRGAAAAVPAGAVIWMMANWSVGGSSLLSHLTAVLDPMGRVMGLDGVILAAFVLGFPAHETVVPIMLTAYLQSGYLIDMTDSAILQNILINNGWTWKTALCMMIFSLFHWPCLTTCLAVRKETGSAKWAAVAIALPTVLGVVLCMAVNGVIFQM